MTDLEKQITRTICTRNSGGYCDFIGHGPDGCMVGHGQAPDVANCKMTDEAMPLTAEYTMARAVLDLPDVASALNPIVGLGFARLNRTLTEEQRQAWLTQWAGDQQNAFPSSDSDTLPTGEDREDGLRVEQG